MDRCWLLMIVMLAGCGRDYPDAARTRFMKSCVDGMSTQRYCSCCLEGLEDAYEYGDYLLIQDKLKRGIEPPEKFQKVALECRAKHYGR